MAALSVTPSKPPRSGTSVRYHKPGEAAALLKVGERWLRDGANHHGFPHSRPGKWLVFSDDDLAVIYEMFRVPARVVRRGRAA
jgi:hypothetical protein